MRQRTLNSASTKSVETSQEDKMTILGNEQVQTDTTITNNTADIIISNNNQEICPLADTAISGDRNVTQKNTKNY